MTTIDVEEKLNKKVSLEDIASSLGVSKSTVSRAISGKGRISEETRMKVIDCINRLNYRPNVIAKSLAQSKTFNIGVVLPADKDIDDIPFFQGCLMGICEITAALDYDVVVTTATNSDISQLVRLIQNRKVDGIILTRSLVNDPAVAFLESENIPFVLIGSSQDTKIPQIDTDHAAACSELTSYLISSGCKNLSLLLGSQAHIVNKSRLLGYINAFDRIGSRPTEGLIYDNMVNRASIDRAIIELLDRGSDCIVCGDDYICSRALSSLEERGIAIPSNIKIASFYNSAFLRCHNPPITAINVNVAEIGLAAGKIVIDLISGIKVPQKTLLGYGLTIKRSTL